MSIADITFVTKGIHRPDEPRHFMRLKPVMGGVRISRGGQELARSGKALRVLEAGRDLYDPVVYLPREDVSASLREVEGKSTHCPLKGDTAYFDLMAADGSIAERNIAWSYTKPLSFAMELKDLIAFDPAKVSVMEQGPSDPGA